MTPLEEEEEVAQPPQNAQAAEDWGRACNDGTDGSNTSARHTACAVPKGTIAHRNVQYDVIAIAVEGAGPRVVVSCELLSCSSRRGFQGDDGNFLVVNIILGYPGVPPTYPLSLCKKTQAGVGAVPFSGQFKATRERVPCCCCASNIVSWSTGEAHMCGADRTTL